MTPCVSRELLCDFVAGRTEPDFTGQIVEHLANCTNCQQLVDSLTEADEVREFHRSFKEDLAEGNDETISVEFRRNLYAMGNRTGTDPSNNRWAATGRHWEYPESIGRFRLRDRLGSGGFGVVFLAEDTQLNRPVALKLPRTHALLDPQGRTRFFREAKAAAALHHPQIVAVYDAGDYDGICYLASAYCPGETLAKWMQSRNAPAAQDVAVQIVLALADATEFAHENSVLHRDIKPQNILLDPTSHFRDLPFSPKLTDFGIAKIIDASDNETATELILGTPRYMAPELVAGRREQLGPACDIYALGVVLYELITGCAPFNGNSHAETLRHVLDDEPVRPRTLVPQISRDLEAICLTCLEKAPERRYTRAGLLASDLERFLMRQPTVARPIGAPERIARWVRRRPAAAGLVAVSVVASLLLFTGLTIYNDRLGVLNLNLRESNDSLERALHDAQESQGRAERSEEGTAQLLYVSDMRLAAQAAADSDTRELRELLRRHLPRPTSVDRRGLEWRYLWNRSEQATRVIQQDNDAVYCVRESPDGRRIATAGKDAVIRLYDADTGSFLCSITTGQREVNSVSFTPDGLQLVSAGDDGTIRFWDSGDGRPLRTIAAHRDLAYCGVFTPDGTTLITCGNESTIKIWDAASGELQATLPGNARHVDAVAISPDGRLLGSAGGDGHIRIWDWRTGRELFGLRTESVEVPAICFSRDGRQLVSGGYDGGVLLWEVATGRLLARGKQFDMIHSIAISKDGREIFAGDSAGVVHFWRVPNQPEVDGDRLGPPAALELVRSWQVHDTRIHSLLVSDGDRLATGSADGSVRLWQVRTYEMMSELEWSAGRVNDFQFIPRTSLAAVAFDDRICLCDAATGSIVRELSNEPADWQGLHCDREGKLIAAVGRNGTASLWELSTGQRLHTWSLGGGSEPRAVQVSPDGRLVAAFAGGTQEVIYIFDVATGDTVNSYRDSLGMFTSLSFSPNSERMAIIDGKRIIYWDFVGSRRYENASAHLVTVSDLAFSPDGSVLATVGTDRQVKLWDPTTLSPTASLSGHRAPVDSVVFSSDGRSLVTADRDGFLKVWNVATGKHILDLHRHTASFVRLRIDGDGRRLAGIPAGTDRRVILFDLGKPLP